MIVDTSALIAVVNGGGDAPLCAAALADAPAARILAANRLETAIVADAGVEIVPMTARHAELARDAYRRFGMSDHPAGLTFGDCFAPVLTAERGKPLLFKGNDFAQSDVARVI
jgi:ribonuclease VapC